MKLWKIFRLENGVRKRKARCVAAGDTADEAIESARKRRTNVQPGMALVAKRMSDAETRDYIARTAARLRSNEGAEILRRLQPKGTA